MNTNFIFQRQVTIDGVTKIVTKIVPVSLPSIDSGEGWIYKGHTDIIELENLDCCSIKSKSNAEPVETAKTTKRKKVNPEAKFQSPVEGLAKLVKVKGVIKIAARQGKSTFNQTTPNGVCISNKVRDEFFADCRNIHGSSGVYYFTKADGGVYDYWNKVITAEYTRQKEIVDKARQDHAEGAKS